MMVDRRRVVQVLDNLLANAAQHAPESTPIRVTAGLDSAHVAISVSGEGRGVAPDLLPHLFRKHGGGRAGATAGHGLGFAICKGLVEAHGGRIRAESAGAGRGTTLTLTLPAAGSGRCARGDSRSVVWMRSISAASRSQGTASSFVMGGSRPARGGLSVVVSRRVGVFRSCSIPVVRLLRTVRSCGAAFHDSHRLRSGRMSRWMSGPGAALRARPALLSWCSFLSLKCGRWIPFGPCAVPVGSSMKFFVVVLGVVAILVFCSVPRLRGRRCSVASRRVSAAWQDGRPVYVLPTLTALRECPRLRVWLVLSMVAPLRASSERDAWARAPRGRRGSPSSLGPGVVGSLCGVSSVRGGTPVGVFGFSMPGCSMSCGFRCWWSRSGRSDRLPAYRES